MSAVLVPNESKTGRDTGVRLWRWTRDAYHRADEQGWFNRQKVELLDGKVWIKHPGPADRVFPDEIGLGVVSWRWSREQFYEAAEIGILNPNDRLELIFGRVYQQLPHGDLHSMGIDAAAEAVRTAFPIGFYFREQRPLALSTDGAPEPDLLVVPGSWRDYPHAPTQADAVLLVEVSDSTLRYDRTEKAADYAEAGVADYWISNLQNRTLEVRRSPAPAPGNPYGFDYQDVSVYTEEDSVAPLAAPETLIRVADFLPPVRRNESASDDAL